MTDTRQTFGLTCTFRAHACQSTRLSWALVLASPIIRDKNRGLGEEKNGVLAVTFVPREHSRPFLENCDNELIGGAIEFTMFFLWRIYIQIKQICAFELFSGYRGAKFRMDWPKIKLYSDCLNFLCMA